MKKKGWFSLEKIKRISKNQLFIGGLAGILLLIIAMPADTDKNKEQNMPEKESSEKTEQGAENKISYGRELERKLEQILGEMEGVGKVEVMITLKDDGERILDKDITRSSQEVSEEDGTVKRNTRESQYQEETVFSKETENGQPFVAKETTPQIEGVLVVAEGGENAKTVKNISDAVLALFPVEVHKIKVVKMN